MSKEENRRVVSLTILPDLLEKVDDLAKAAGISRSRYIELMIKRETEETKHE